MSQQVRGSAGDVMFLQSDVNLMGRTGQPARFGFGRQLKVFVIEKYHSKKETFEV